MLPARIADVPVLEPSADRVHVNTVSSLVSALGSAVKGRTIMLADGTYDLSRVWPLRIRAEGVQLYGASRDPAKVVLKGAGFGSSNTDEELIKIEAVGVRLAYFTLRDGRANGVKIQTGGNHDLLIHNVNFVDICERSIKGPDAAISRNGIVRFCTFEQKTPITSAIPGLKFDGDYIAGMDMMKIEGWKIHDNEFKNIRGMTGGGRAGIFLWKGCKNITIERNLFMGCDRAIAFGNPSSADLDMEGGIIRNNFIVAGKGISIEVCNSTGSQIANNTVFSTNPGYTRTIFFLGNKQGVALKNNLVLGKLGVQSGSLPDTAGNLFITVASQANSWFHDVSTGDLHLRPAAAMAINKGVPLASVNSDIDAALRDNRPDIGADEMEIATAIHPLAPASGIRVRSASAPLDWAGVGLPGGSSWYAADGRRLSIK